jgi:hypothetical protein
VKRLEEKLFVPRLERTKEGEGYKKIVDIMDDYISWPCWDVQSSEYLGVKPGNFFKIKQTKLIRKYIDNNEAIKKICVLLKLKKRLLIKLTKYNDSKTSGNFDRLHNHKHHEFSETYKDEFAELGNADLIKLKRRYGIWNADLEVWEQKDKNDLNKTTK